MPQSPREPIAIVGIGCRFPGANHPEAFWQMLCDGVDAVRDVPADRWDASSFHDPEQYLPGTACTRRAAFVDLAPGAFDAKFFGMSPREAGLLDPMQAWLMEVTWEALEDAGIPLERMAGSQTGVFVGVFIEDGKILQLRESNRTLIGKHSGGGTAMTMAANRLSFWFDLRGPSIAVDTACSSSLVAVHLACQSLWTGETTMAIAGGVNALFTPEFSIVASKAGLLSPDGCCKTFDARANGYVRGEGAAMVVLKPLAQALADRDGIYAVIRATATNQDGRTKSMTLPSSEAQKEVALRAFRLAGLDPSQVAYVEAHGTGTAAGDPIECKALGAVFGKGRPDGDRCWVGSLKTNIGHLEAAAGVAGLIKAALCLKYKSIPPHLHYETPNPDIDFEGLRLRVPVTLTPLPETSEPALVAVNSFGFGGANAHAVLSEAPPSIAKADGPTAPALITISARSPASLQGLAASYRELAAANARAPETKASLRELAAATARRRTHHAHRLAIVADSYGELADALDTRAGLAQEAREDAIPSPEQARERLAFVYTGMGPQWWGMGRALMAAEPVFRQAIEQCDSILGRSASWSLLEEMSADEATSRMGRTHIAQPANFALQVGLTLLLRSWGIEPAAVVGHSAGEIAACWAAGVLSLEQACAVVFHRSRLQQRTSGQGGMLSVALSHDEALEAMADEKDVAVAAMNGPRSVTLAGDPASLERLMARLGQGVCRRLSVEVPFHSHYMDPLREELCDALRTIEPTAARVPLVSTVTGRAVEGSAIDADHWWRNVREPVRFAQATSELLARGVRTFLEIGPHPVLRNDIRECAGSQQVPVALVPSLRKDGRDSRNVLDAVGALYTAGIDPDWDAVHRHDGESAPAAAVKLPPYVWERAMHWLESAESRQDRLGAIVHPLLGRRRTATQPTWQATLGQRAPGYLADHAIQGAVIFPAAAYMEMGLAAVRETTGRSTTAVELHDLRFHRAMFLRSTPQIVQTTFDRDELRFTVHSRGSVTEEQWEVHATGHAKPVARMAPARTNFERLRANLSAQAGHDGAACYQILHTHHFQYGPRFQGLRRLFVRGGESLAHVEVESSDDCTLPPNLFDACFHGFLTSVALERSSQTRAVFLPVEIARLTVSKPLRGRLWVHASIVEAGQKTILGNIDVYSEEGELLAAMEGAHLQALDSASGPRALSSLFYTPTWIDVERRARDDEPARPWLLFADTKGMAGALAARIEAAGGSAVLVRGGDAFEADSSKKHYSIDPRCPEHFERLLATLERAPEGIVHAWALDAPDTASLTSQGLMDAQDRIVGSVHHLVRAIATRESPPRLWLVTHGARALPDDAGAPEIAQSPLWGLASALFQQEHPELAGGVVDLDPNAKADDTEDLWNLLSAPPADNQLALRGRQILGERLLPAPELAEQVLPIRLRPDATYVITGGRGGLGLVFARALIRRGARRLVLMSRTPLPPRHQWHAARPDSAEGKQIAAIRELEALGAAIHAPAVDVADEAALRTFLEEFRREGWPSIRGVLHAAGVASPCPFGELTAARQRTTMDPKLAGTWNMHAQLRNETLDFFVVCSSVAAQGFSFNMADYATANAFLDALAHARRKLGEHALTINWGPWAEVGMAADEQLARELDRLGFLGILPSEGADALDRCLDHDVAQATVLASNWTRMLRANYPTPNPPLLLEPIARQLEETQESDDTGTVADDVRARLAAARDEEQRQDILEGYLQTVVARSLRMPADDVHRWEDLHALGLDSILAVELRHRIASGLGVGPTILELLEGASITTLAASLLPRVRLLEATEPAPDDDLDRLAAELGALSPEESEALFASLEGASPT